MKKLFAATLIAFALSTPAMAFDLNGIDGIPSDMKEMIAKQSGGRITNKQSGQQQGQQQQAGQDGQQQQQQGGRQAKKKKQSAQERAMQSADQFLKGDTGTIGQGIGSFR
jgi:hypothetical protein